MNKGTKIALTFAACLIGLGLILLCISINMEGFRWDAFRSSGFDTTNTVVKTVEITDKFHSIRVEEVECDVRIFLATDGKCTVVYTDCDRFTHEIDVENQTLTVTYEQTGSWADHFQFNLNTEHYVKIYLPMETLEKLEITSASGDLSVSKGFTFTDVNMTTASGDVSFSSHVSGTLSASAASGDISMSNVTAASVRAETGSGDFELNRVEISGHMALETGSGDIELDRVDSSTAKLETGSGDIEGTILSPKNFNADTGSGELQLPNDDPYAGLWELDTGSGDIELNIA